MLLVDDILFAPFRALMYVAREITNAAQHELDDERQCVTADLSELYMLLETGQITSDEFDAREKALLDRLDELDAESDAAEADDDEADDDAADETDDDEADDGGTVEIKK